MAICDEANCSRLRRCTSCNQCNYDCRCPCAVNLCPNIKACNACSRCHNHCTCADVSSWNTAKFEDVIQHWVANRAECITKDELRSSAAEGLKVASPNHARFILSFIASAESRRVDSRDLPLQTCLLNAGGSVYRGLTGRDRWILREFGKILLKAEVRVSGNCAITYNGLALQSTSPDCGVAMRPIEMLISDGRCEVKEVFKTRIELKGYTEDVYVLTATGNGEPGVVPAGATVLVMDHNRLSEYSSRAYGLEDFEVRSSLGWRGSLALCKPFSTYSISGRDQLVVLAASYLDNSGVEFIKVSKTADSPAGHWDSQGWIRRTEVMEEAGRRKDITAHPNCLVLDTSELKLIESLNVWYLDRYKGYEAYYRVTMASTLAEGAVSIESIADRARLCYSDVLLTMETIGTFQRASGRGCYLPSCPVRESGLKLKPLRLSKAIGCTVILHGQDRYARTRDGRPLTLTSNAEGGFHLEVAEEGSGQSIPISLTAVLVNGQLRGDSVEYSYRGLLGVIPEEAARNQGRIVR